MKKNASFSDLVGKTLISVEKGNDSYNGETLVFTTNTGEVYQMIHYQDCCESVYIEDIVGDLSDLVGSPILKTTEDSNSEDNSYGSKTWTFYNLATIKGHVTIRWYGSSNGYYSERVDFEQIIND